MVYDPEVVSFLSGEVARYKRLAAIALGVGDSENSRRMSQSDLTTTVFILQSMAIMNVAEEYSRIAERKRCVG